jgi:hypothetical protein
MALPSQSSTRMAAASRSLPGGIVTVGHGLGSARALEHHGHHRPLPPFWNELLGITLGKPQSLIANP